ncbi:PAS-domain containing protein [Curvibacter sp. HBC28]|uniref:diguanylate cyclase n=1 Tax=Curvibacter microcysteis TaxID=3026419 RepID=A0ABT5M9J4_9BURK|nr:PAS-domain containing protein [Curvibacter sp. HBC28]MDD0813260.1 PAS-domain containing protein [Curvibacter sp. HBC28]
MRTGQPEILQAIIDHLPSAVSMFDADLNMVACNRRLRTLLDFPDHLFEPSLPSLYDLALFNAQRGEYGPGDPAAQAEALCTRARSMEPHVFERQRPGGITLEVRGAPLPGGGFVTIYTDISERKRAEHEAKRYAAYLNTVIEALPQGVTVIDENLVIQLWNQSFERLLDLPLGLMQPGVTFEDVTRSNALRGEYGDIHVEQRVQEAAALARQFLPHRLIRQRPNGSTLEIEGRVLQIDGEQRGFVTTYTDITEISNAREKLEQMALHDPLTGLPNRTQFENRFQLEIDRQRRGSGPLALVMVDIDHFKRINDEHGHLTGDACLKAFASLLHWRVRRTDLVARFGGEEFLILLPDTDASQATQLAESLREAIATMSVPGAPTLTASFGVTTLQPGASQSLAQLIERADMAVYRAKAEGRNCVCQAADPNGGDKAPHG